MTTKTASIRLDKSKFREIDDRCDSLECSRNDFIKKAIEKELNNKDSAVNKIDNCECCDQESKETMKMIINNLHDLDNLGLKTDDDGRPLEVDIAWNYDEDESKKPKIELISEY